MNLILHICYTLSYHEWYFEDILEFEDYIIFR